MNQSTSRISISRLFPIVIVVGAMAIAVALFFRGSKENAIPFLDPDTVIVLRTPGGMLEVATLVRNEEFRWSTVHTCPPFNCETLFGATLSEVRVPVHYTYRIRLAADWKLKVSDKHLELAVPKPEPKLPAAIQLRELEIRTNRTWFSPGKTEHRESVIRNLGPEIDRRAVQKKYVDVLRDEAKKTVAEFAKKWMIEQSVEPKLRGYEVRVSFPDDPH